MFQTELADKSFYTVSIRKMKLRLAELQESDIETQKFSPKELEEGPGKYIDVDGVLHHQGLPFVPKIIWIEVAS